jgi:hypothetical protein
LAMLLTQPSHRFEDKLPRRLLPGYSESASADLSWHWNAG